MILFRKTRWVEPSPTDMRGFSACVYVFGGIWCALATISHPPQRRGSGPFIRMYRKIAKSIGHSVFHAYARGCMREYLFISLPNWYCFEKHNSLGKVQRTCAVFSSTPQLHTEPNPVSSHMHCICNIWSQVRWILSSFPSVFSYVVRARNSSILSVYLRLVRDLEKWRSPSDILCFMRMHVVVCAIMCLFQFQIGIVHENAIWAKSNGHARLSRLHHSYTQNWIRFWAISIVFVTFGDKSVGYCRFFHRDSRMLFEQDIV